MEVQGGKELIALLKDLPSRLAKRVLRQALDTAATPIRKAAAAHVPQDTGTLKKHIIKKVKTYKEGSVIALIGAEYVPIFIGRRKLVPSRYDHLVEFGTAAHGNHPGMAARPFLRPAYSSNKERAKEIMAEKVREFISRLSSK